MQIYKKTDIGFQKCLPIWHLLRGYSAIIIFTVLHTVICITISMSQGSQLHYRRLSHEQQNLERMNDNNTNNNNNSNRLIIENPDEYFDPDEILFHPSDRKTDSFEIDTNNNTYISLNESPVNTASKYPIKPLKENPIELPEPDYRPKLVPHVLSKELWPVDFVSRKIFIRDKK